MKTLYTTIIAFFWVLTTTVAQTYHELPVLVDFSSSTSDVAIVASNGTTFGLTQDNPVEAAFGSYLLQTGKQTGSNKTSTITLGVNASNQYGMKLTWYERGGSDITRSLVYRIGNTGEFVNTLVVSEIIGAVWVKKSVILPAALDNKSNIELQWQVTVNNGITGDKYAIDGIRVDLLQPVINISETSLSFEAELGGASKAKTYTLSGTELLASGVTVSSNNSNFKVSLTGTSYSSSVNVPAVNNSLSTTTIYVQYEATEVGSHTGLIEHTGTRISTGNVEVKGVTSDIPAGSMPVELASFQGQAAKGAAKLSWTTATETNNDKFVVERSQNGKDFSKVGEVKGNGNSSVKLSYSYTDSAPVSGVNYYRLRQVDFDGAEEFSNVIALKVAGSMTATVFPTVATSAVSISLEQVTGNVTISVVDANGKPVATYNSTAERLVELPVQNLKSGVYFVRIANGQSQQVLRFIKN